ncbi:MAG: uroporphyrinogen decarboxylase family protein [Phycisphaerae bacterium]
MNGDRECDLHGTYTVHPRGLCAEGCGLVTMTPRENLLCVLAGRRPEWIPVTGHCDPYNQPNKMGMDAALAAALANVQWGDESTITFSRYLGLDIADWFGPPLRSRQQKVHIESARDGDAQITLWNTPRGQLRQVERYSPGTNLWHTAEHMIKTVADLPLLAEVFDDAVPELAPQAHEIVRRRKDLIGQDGILMFPLSGTPLGQMVRVHAGVETLAYLWADGRKELHELFRVMEDNHLRCLRAASELDGDVIVIVDDTSTTTLSPAMFEECCLGYTDRMAASAHAEGKFYFHHSCGHIRDLLGLYRCTKMDAVHAFTIPPIGNVTIGQGRRLLGGDITIFAGLTQMSEIMTDRQAAARSIRTMFEEAYPGDHFILGLAADPEKTMEETAFVADECRKHQRMV